MKIESLLLFIGIFSILGYFMLEAFDKYKRYKIMKLHKRLMREADRRESKFPPYYTDDDNRAEAGEKW